MRAEVLCGDARDVLATLDDASVDSVITDPPYALTSGKNSTKGFMSAQWDNGSVAHDPAFWAEVLRVAKPGAFLLAFGGTRTYHRLACAIEDAGWELRDMIVHWLYGSGFPKSTSCLKPSQEPIVLAKAPGPLQPLQIDAARVPTGGLRPAHTPTGRTGNVYVAGLEGSRRIAPQTQGRWPPNTLFSHVGGPNGCQPAGVRRVRGAGWRDTDGSGGQKIASGAVLGNRQSALRRPASGHHTDAEGYESVDAWTCVDGCPIKALDAQAGPRTSRNSTAGVHGQDIGYHGHGSGSSHAGYHGEEGGPSRFFPTIGPDPADAVPFRYQPKAPASERRLADGTPTGHPTQKPVALACWLASLVCGPGGTVLDPFAGVGSLGVGALRAGCHYVGIEQDAGYARVAQRRLDEEQEQQAGPLFAGVGTATSAAR